MQDNNTIRLSRLKLLVGLFFVIVFSGWAMTQISRSGETKVVVHIIPEDAQVTMNGKPASGGPLYLKPGEYTFSASKNGFKTDTQKLTVGSEAQEVGLLPEPESAEAKEWLEKNPRIQQARESYGGLNANREGQEVQNQTPILEFLPVTLVEDGPFSIDYGKTTKREKGVFLEISDSSPEGREKAISWIRDHQQDPTDLEIRYVDFVNPFSPNREYSND